MTARTANKLAQTLDDLRAVTDTVNAERIAQAKRDLTEAKERAASERRILAVLTKADRGPATRSELAEAVGLSRSGFYAKYGQALAEAKNKAAKR